VLSQDGDQTSGFALQYLETGKWAFSLSNADVASPTLTSAVSTAAPSAGTWTHLTGVYDATAHTATLYVNGQAQQTVTATAAGGTGPLVLGGAKSAGARSTLFKGSIDEAAAFGRALSAADVATLYGQNGVPTGLAAAREYTLDGDTTDATGTDGVLTTKNLTYGQGYSDSAGQSATDDGIGHGSGQALVDQGPGYATTSSPVVDTKQSFSVSLWVKLKDANFYTLVGQEGAHGNAFQISTSTDNVGMGLSATDTGDATAAGWQWASSPIAPHVGVWTQLTAVYDAVAGKERFYVNGAAASETVIQAGMAWRGTGPFTVGKVGDQNLGTFNGSIDQVQVWDRALPAAEIAGLANTAVLRANYQLDGTTTDTVSGTAGTPSGAVSMTTDNAGANVARFGRNPGGQIATSRPANFRSDRSFTVEAWVKHTWTAADAAAAKQQDPADTTGVDEPGRTALGANAAQFSPYLLGYRGAQDANGVWHPRWSWMIAGADTTPAKPTAWWLLPDGEAESNVWTHLAGTYDAITHTACLYVQTDAYIYSPKCVPNVIAWNGASDLESMFLGRGRFGGADSDYWYGDLRGIRVYSGVLDQQHINADTVIDHP
jgi:hypothetical protein